MTCNAAKRAWTLQERGLDMLRAKEVFAGLHFTRPDDREDYGRIISMRHCHDREAKKLRPHLARD
jgi:uncharacterized DUF497 family protein